jgi:hypothetical protein
MLHVLEANGPVAKLQSPLVGVMCFRDLVKRRLLVAYRILILAMTVTLSCLRRYMLLRTRAPLWWLFHKANGIRLIRQCKESPKNACDMHRYVQNFLLLRRYTNFITTSKNSSFHDVVCPVSHLVSTRYSVICVSVDTVSTGSHSLSEIGKHTCNSCSLIKQSLFTLKRKNIKGTRIHGSRF